VTIPTPPWERAARRLPARTPLSRDAIVTAAMAVLARDGAAGVTMRRVADELGTGPASLYAHVTDKEELENLVFDRIAGETPVPTPDPARWREQLKELLTAQMETLSRYRGAAGFAFGRIPYGRNALAHSEAVLELLRLGGVDDRVAAFATDLLHQYVIANAYENSEQPPGGDGLSKAMEHYAQVNAYFKTLPVARFPNIVRLADTLFDVGEDRFTFGLDILLTGLTSYPAASSRSGPSSSVS
jgi:AcrR family transcriptional regulator